MKAVKRFDPSRGVRLFSFAIHWIKAEINEFVLKNWKIVKIATTKSQRKLFFNLRGLKNKLGADINLNHDEAQTIADTLNVTRDEVFEVNNRFVCTDVTVALVSGFYFLKLSFALYKNYTEKLARKHFKYSIYYLIYVFAALMIDKVIQYLF
jgi:hypothetical protein